ncbi:PREDICTED: uncharacterized protein LOC109153113 [Ipomoea nil]|uniref:uncharacterized protein LOC109153113 n=1 Tax=Ipomoea nil TaxID=35883 RepID=UPI00090188B7|nr:PREDICTED: uncharacterized protein LOC109153113 [Ipomoea nil]
MAWNGATSRPLTATTDPSSVATPPNTAPANSIPTRANFDTNDAASPFFLHPNENPSLVLVSSVLNGRNYHPWARAMEMSLLSKNKLGFVDGTIVVPKIAQTILWVGTAEKIWNTLKARFSKADIFRISDLHAEIHQIRQGDLTVIRPLPMCKCERMCDCGLLETLQHHIESDNLSVFLRGLNETYVSVQSQIMMTKPLPSVDEAFIMVQQQEMRLNNGITGMQIQEAGSILLTQGNGSGPKKFHSNNNNKKPIFSYCGFTGHTIEKCYKKHGYPPGWKQRNRSVGFANQVQFTPDDQTPSENNSSVTLSQDEYRLLKQFLQRDSMVHNSSPLNEA